MSLIYVKHPHKAIQENQETFLESLDKEQQVKQALMFNFGNASYRYHTIEPTKDDYEQWLEGLPENVRASFKTMGYEKSKSALPLKRFANEMRDNGMDEYIKNLLKPEDFEAIQSISKS
jgi:hypothetical protein